jgi:hypothetical protein
VVERKINKWTCPKCNTEYVYPDPDETRILIIKPRWDFCPKDGTKRESK